MVTIDLKGLSTREANEGIREAAARGDAIEVLNPDARHHIGVGVVHAVDIHVRGSAGYFCAGLTDTPHFHVERNAGWGLADNMYRGSVVVGGNAGAIAGVAIRGAEVVIRGNMGSRAGQVMKKGTLLCCGNANFMAGYMMYGGRMIILGESGERLGEDMTGGEIFLGGDLVSLGSDAMETDTAEDEIDDVRAFLDRYDIPFRGSFRKNRECRKETALRYAGNGRCARFPTFTFPATATTGITRSRKTSTSSPRSAATG